MDSFNKEHFIDEIKRRPVLWDTECPEYLNRMLKKQAWMEVTDIFANPCDSEERKLMFGLMLQKKWKNLKDTYIKEYKKLKNNTSGIGQKGSNYMYFSRLSFLQKCIDGRNTGSPNYESSLLYLDDFSDKGDSSEEIVQRLRNREISRVKRRVNEMINNITDDEPNIVKDIKQYEKPQKDKFTSEWKEKKNDQWNYLFDYIAELEKKMSFINHIPKVKRQHTLADPKMDVDTNIPLRAGLPKAKILQVLTDYTLKKDKMTIASQEEMLQKEFLTNEDEDKMFCLSLYKELKKIPESNRLTSKIELLDVLKRAQLPSISSYGVPYLGSNKSKVFIPPNYITDPYNTYSFGESKEMGSAVGIAEPSPFIKYIKSKSKSKSKSLPETFEFKGWIDESSEHLKSRIPVSEKSPPSPGNSSLSSNSSVDMNE